MPGLCTESHLERNTQIDNFTDILSSRLSAKLLISINEFILHQALLVFGRVTVYGWVNHLGK